ncbi:MAG: molybdopterin-dependent oxidoreductase [Deltaproteobacteria bacterium]|nr:MAG: molybdopterin-dependent oxidoreductase [Deltaproteobacteria bacterium]
MVRTDDEEKEQVIPTVCASHCGGSCVLKVHVRDGTITRIETDDGEEPQFRACLKGRAYRQRVYSPDRLRYPMRRAGERGEGKFERISWDQALDTVAGEIKRVRDTYGSQAILFRGGAGDITLLNNATPMNRLLCMAGGFTDRWGASSYEGGIFAEMATYGTIRTGSTSDNFIDSRLIIMWGWNPAETIQYTNTSWYLAQAKEHGTRIVSIDPRHTDSAAIFADEWIPLRPGTDAAMLIAMAYIIIKEDLQDQRFLDTYTVGFGRYKDYVLGIEDGIPKTPAWASEITEVPSTTIERVAREYATSRPAALVAGIAPGRSAYGEQYHRAAIVLTAMTGNIGIRGGGAAGRTWQSPRFGGFPFKVGQRMTVPPNPTEEKAPFRKNALPPYGPDGNSARIHSVKTTDAILKGKAGGYPSDYRLLYVVNTDFLNQRPDINATVRALKALEFIVVQEQVMSPMAKYADILLPGCTFLERNDITLGGATPFYGSMNKVIEPLYESKSHLQIATLLAERLGISDFNDKTEEEWLHQIMSGSDVSDYDRFKEKGIFKIKGPLPYIAFQKQIEDLAGNPFPTPSGKIEIFSQQLADMANPEIPPIPKWIQPWEGWRDSLAKKYPLQLVTTHFKRRAHTQFGTLPWLRELQPQAMLINSIDAQARGIGDKDKARVFNDRGELIIAAKVTERIRPGVVDIPQGAWYDPDEKGVDRGGSANVLIKAETSPGGAFCFNTALVEVRKV